MAERTVSIRVVCDTSVIAEQIRGAVARLPKGADAKAFRKKMVDGLRFDRLPTRRRNTIMVCPRIETGTFI